MPFACQDWEPDPDAKVDPKIVLALAPLGLPVVFLTAWAVTPALPNLGPSSPHAA